MRDAETRFSVDLFLSSGFLFNTLKQYTYAIVTVFDRADSCLRWNRLLSIETTFDRTDLLSVIIFTQLIFAEFLFHFHIPIY